MKSTNFPFNYYKQFTVNEIAGIVDPTEQKHGPVRKLDSINFKDVINSLLNKGR